VSAPLARGILVTAFVELPASVTAEQVGERFAASYAAEPFVRVVTSRLPEVAAVAGSNFAEVGFTLGREQAGDPARRTLAVVAALDNLIKGGAGQAIEDMNIMLGLPETAALEDAGPWP